MPPATYPFLPTDAHSFTLDDIRSPSSSPHPSSGVDTPFLRAVAKYHAIVSEWVTAYVQHFYPTGVHVAKDTELLDFIEQARRDI